MNQEITALTLNSIKEVPTKFFRDMVINGGTLTGLLEKPWDELVQTGIPMKAAQAIADADIKFAENELKRLKKLGGKLITIESSEYPELLRQIPDPPLVLYVIGNLKALDTFSISLVGARKVSRTGIEMAQKLAKDLSKCGVTIVSGLAYGVDINAHLATLETQGVTVAVLGSGFENLYPGSHKKYIDAICQDGCVISEFPLDEKPNAYNFPIRNRIISGLSMGVVIVEASMRSGSLITSKLALEQGRDVFAVPVSPLAINNATNVLIQNGAILVQNYKDILAEYSHLFNITEESEDKTVMLDSEEKQKIYDVVSIEPLSMDEIVDKTGLRYDIVAINVMNMELEDILARGGDARYFIKR